MDVGVWLYGVFWMNGPVQAVTLRLGGGTFITGGKGQGSWADM